MRGLVTSIIGLFALFIDRGVSFSPSSSAVHNVHYAPIIASIGRTTTTTNLKSSNNMIGDVEIEALMGSTMEQARLTNQYARFGHSDWLNHRSSDRFYRALLEFDKSPVVKNLLDEALVLASICVFIIVYNGSFTVGFTDFNEIHHDPIFANSVPNWIAVKLCLPTDPFFLCSGPLGLLLVFRNDVCFGRYKEAFSYWESAMSSLTNMLLMTSNASTNVEAVRNLGIASWVVARTTQHEVLVRAVMVTCCYSLFIELHITVLIIFLRINIIPVLFFFLHFSLSKHDTTWHARLLQIHNDDDNDDDDDNDNDKFI